MISAEARVAAAIAGDRRALDAVIAMLLPRVRNLARYLIGDDGEADAIAEDVMVVLLRALPAYRNRGLFMPWADRIAVRETFACMGRPRRKGRPATADLMIVPHPDDRPDPYAERRRAVALLDLLPDEERHALVLHHVVGWSIPEIAEQTGAPVEAVRRRLHLGLDGLRRFQASSDGGPR